MKSILCTPLEMPAIAYLAGGESRLASLMIVKLIECGCLSWHIQQQKLLNATQANTSILNDTEHLILDSLQSKEKVILAEIKSILSPETQILVKQLLELGFISQYPYFMTALRNSFQIAFIFGLIYLTIALNKLPLDQVLHLIQGYMLIIFILYISFKLIIKACISPLALKLAHIRGHGIARYYLTRRGKTYLTAYRQAPSTLDTLSLSLAYALYGNPILCANRYKGLAKLLDYPIWTKDISIKNHRRGGNGIGVGGISGGGDCGGGAC